MIVDTLETYGHYKVELVTWEDSFDVRLSYQAEHRGYHIKSISIKANSWLSHLLGVEWRLRRAIDSVSKLAKKLCAESETWTKQSEAIRRRLLEKQ